MAGREEARRAALATGLPRALAGTTGLSPAVLVTFGLAGWLYWRILVSHRHALDTWLVWTFNVVFIIVAAQLVLACFEGRMIGQRDDHRIAVLIPLYNEDPDVVRRMLRALLHQSTRRLRSMSSMTGRARAPTPNSATGSSGTQRSPVFTPPGSGLATGASVTPRARLFSRSVMRTCS